MLPGSCGRAAHQRRQAAAHRTWSFNQITTGFAQPHGVGMEAPISRSLCFYYGVSVKELIWYTHRTDSERRFGEGKVEERERWELRFS